MTFDLKTARLNAGHTMSSLAALLDVHRNVIASLESGRSVHPANAKKVADHFGVQVTDLMPVTEPVSR